MESLGSPFEIGLCPTQYQMKFLPNKEVESNEDVTPLHVSVLYNKVEFIESLIVDYQINVNYQDDFGNTALMIAAQTGNVEAAKELIKHNASKSLVNKYGQTAILVALRSGKAEVAKVIIKSLTNPFQNLSSTDNSGYTVLHYAGYCNDEEILNIIDELCYVDDMIENTVNPSCSTPLHFAAMNGSDKTVAWLLKKGASPMVENCMGQSPLLLGIRNKHKESVEILLEVSTGNIPDNYGQLALHYAAAVGCDIELIQKIYNKFPKALSKMDTNGNFPFHHSVKSNDKKILDFFFVTGGKSLLVKKNSNGLTPLMIAVACGAIESFKYLRDMGSDLYVKSMSGTTPFLLACGYGQKKMAEVLFKDDPSVIGDCDNSGNTAVHYAVQNNQIEILKWIRGIAPEIIKKANSIGETPLHIACLCGYKNIVENLEVFGLSMTEVTKSGRTAFHYAVLGGHLTLVRQIGRSCKTGLFVGDKNKLTPLHYCCVYGMVHLIDDIIAAAPETLNARDGCGRTPLHVAVVMNDAVSVKKLIEHGCDKTQIDIRKLSAQQSAINRGYIHCYELISGETKFTAIKKVRMVSDFMPEEEELLRLKSNEIVEVYWEHKKGWAVGGINGRYGMFPLAKGTIIPLSKEEQDKINNVMANKKMVKKGVDRKNRSASVAFKETNEQKKISQKSTDINPAALLALQQQPTKPVRKPRKTRGGVVAQDV
ncbi:hypothetical protein ENUP19_0052G0023 [Entamoeba nuttalli]|uniref:Ankyrin repeat protein n=1 Tax=Entamoeba nuttalli TaxID=412467 RepID=A0ABQ0DBY7_9EUKA